MKYDFQENWIEHGTSPTPEEGLYIVESNRGVGAAWFSDWSGKFQDCATNDEEGMDFDDDARPYEVYRYMPMPKGKQ